MPQFVYEVSAARAATSDATASSILGRCIVSAPSERGGGELWVLHGGRGTTSGRHKVRLQKQRVLDDLCCRRAGQCIEVQLRCSFLYGTGTTG